VLVLGNGPNTQDQVVLSTNHTYALEFWVPKTGTGNMLWTRNSVADPGGQGMGSTDQRLTASRITLNALGDAGGTPRTFMTALFGSPTTAAASVNTSTNGGALTFYTVDDFSTNGLSPSNPTNNDWFGTTNVYIAADDEITNVYANWFGSGLPNNVGNISWSGTDAQGNPGSGAMKLTPNPANGQWVIHHGNYAVNPFVNSLVYTGVEMDVKFDVGSASAVDSLGSTNYGPLRIGVRTASNGQDWFYYPPTIQVGNTNWVHISAALNPADPNQQNWQEFLIAMDPNINNWVAGGVGPQTIYVDNIKFYGSATPPPVPPPTIQMNNAISGLRIFAGSAVNTYDRATVSTVNESESWIGGTYPVTYTFSLLSYPNNNINQTAVQLIQLTGQNYLGGSYPTAGNEYCDYQAPNGVWLMISPNGAGRVTAAVFWKTNAPNTNPTNVTMVTITNSTAIGMWKWTFTSDSGGTVTAPGGSPVPFTINDGTVATDFANPMGAVFGLQPNSAAGEGLWEDWGFMAISNTAGPNITTDWTHQNSDFPQSSGISPDGNWSPQGSANPPEIVIQQNGLDALWVGWSTPIPSTGFGVLEGTNLLNSISGTWVQPQFYSGGADTTQPRGGQSVLLGSKYWTLLTTGQLPTVSGTPQPTYPAITVPLSPNAFFVGSTNYLNQP